MNLTTVLKQNVLLGILEEYVHPKTKNIFDPILVYYYTIRLIIAYKHFKQEREIIANLFFF